MRGARGLRQLPARPGIVVAPGAYDAVSARLVERAGFEAVYIDAFIGFGRIEALARRHGLA